MQKYDWPRLFAEVRPTFLPYASFKLQTPLSPEQCQEKIALVTQPQKMPVLISSRTSDDPRLIFKGQVSQSAFFLVPVDHTGRRRFQGPQPFWVKGQFRRSFGGTDLAVHVYSDLLGFVVGCILVVTLVALSVWSASSGLVDIYQRVEEIIVFAPLALLILASVLLATSLKAFQMKQTLKRLLQEG